MPDVREVFQMSTQKVRPDRGFTGQQELRQRRRMRNRKVGAYVVVAGIAAVSVIAFAAVQGGRNDTTVPGTDAPPSAAAPGVTTHDYLDIATGERSPVAAELPEAALPEVSPNGEAIAYNTCCDDDAIFVANLDGSGTEMITPKKLDGYGPTWIDDETILFQGRPEGTSEMGALYVADLSGDDLTKVVDLPNGEKGAWIVISDVSPDATTVVYHLPRGDLEHEKWDLWTAPLAGGEPTLLRRNAGSPQYAPDGSIVFLGHPVPFHGDGVWIMDADGSDARPIVQERGTQFTWPRVSPDGTQVAYGHDGEVEVAALDGTGSGESTGEFADEPAWFGNATLIVP
jgi:hypothetical protein